MFCLGAQKNRLIETVLLSTHNTCFGLEIRKLTFRYTLLTKVLSQTLDCSYLPPLQKVRTQLYTTKTPILAQKAFTEN